MAFAFDTLRYSKRLQDTGIPRPQAEAHAGAARDFIMNELVTKADLAVTIDNLKSWMIIRLGSMIAAGGVAALVVLLRIH